LEHVESGTVPRWFVESWDGDGVVGWADLQPIGLMALES
jgi:hypothetical protein